ncbi:MAG: carbonic anhydrase [Roseivirga sp.]
MAVSGENASITGVVKKNAELTAKELNNRSSIIKNAVDNGDLKIVPAYYNLDSGKVYFL